MRYIFVLILSAILFYGCGEKTNKPQDEKNKFAFDSSDIKTVPIDNPNQQFVMEYKFNPGTTYNYRLTMISDLNQTQKSMSDSSVNMNVHQAMIYLISFTPRETDNSGNTEINCVINSAKIEMEGGGRKVYYNSDSIKTNDDKKRFADNHSLVKNPFTFRINKSGDILDVYKTDGMVNTYLEYTGLKDSAKAEDKVNLKTQINDAVLKPLLTQIFKKFPERTVAKDSSWSINQPKRQMLVFEMDQTNKYSIKQLEKLNNDRIAVVGIDVKTNVTGESKRTEQGVNYDFQKPQISATGTIYFNVDKGWIEKIKTETYSRSSVTAEGKTATGVQRRSSREMLKSQNIVEKY